MRRVMVKFSARDQSGPSRSRGRWMAQLLASCPYGRRFCDIRSTVGLRALSLRLLYFEHSASFVCLTWCRIGDCLLWYCGPAQFELLCGSLTGQFKYTPTKPGMPG